MSGLELESRTDPVAIAALIVGILTIVPGCCCLYFNTPIAIVAAVLGSIAIARIRADETLKGREFAIAAIVLSVIGVVGWVVLAVAGVSLRVLEGVALEGVPA